MPKLAAFLLCLSFAVALLLSVAQGGSRAEPAASALSSPNAAPAPADTPPSPQPGPASPGADNPAVPQAPQPAEHAPPQDAAAIWRIFRARFIAADGRVLDTGNNHI